MAARNAPNCVIVIQITPAAMSAYWPGGCFSPVATQTRSVCRDETEKSPDHVACRGHKLTMLDRKGHDLASGTGLARMRDSRQVAGFPLPKRLLPLW